MTKEKETNNEFEKELEFKEMPVGFEIGIGILVLAILLVFVVNFGGKLILEILQPIANNYFDTSLEDISIDVDRVSIIISAIIGTISILIIKKQSILIARQSSIIDKQTEIAEKQNELTLLTLESSYGHGVKFDFDSNGRWLMVKNNGKSVVSMNVFCTWDDSQEIRKICSNHLVVPGGDWGYRPPGKINNDNPREFKKISFICIYQSLATKSVYVNFQSFEQNRQGIVKISTSDETPISNDIIGDILNMVYKENIRDLNQVEMLFKKYFTTLIDE